MTADTAIPPTTLTRDESRDLRAAFAHLPYGADAAMMGLAVSRVSVTAPEPLTVADVVEGLAVFAVVLREHAERHNALEAEHNALVRDVAGVRRLLGLTLDNLGA
jgi:hypothetical protein